MSKLIEITVEQSIVHNDPFVSSSKASFSAIKKCVNQFYLTRIQTEKTKRTAPSKIRYTYDESREEIKRYQILDRDPLERLFNVT